MDGDALEDGGGGERARSWYLTKEEIERGSPSRRDGVGADKEADLRRTYCCFIHDVCTRLQLPQITKATAILLCHRFYLHQSHAKNEWQTIATVCVFLASKIEDTPCLLKHVVIAAYETMYRKNPDAAKRIHQEEVLAKQKALILVGETLLLSTIRFDFNIQHPYEPLKLALKNLGISQKEVRQRAMSLINDTLPTTLAVQFKPHFIAAGSLFHAATFENFELPSQNGKAWWNEFWNEFDVAPEQQLQAVIQQMSELLFKKKDPCSMVSASKPVPAPIPTPTDKQQQIKPPPTPALMDKQMIKATPIPTPTLTDRQQKIRTPAPALRHTQSSMRSFSSSNTKASSCVTVGSSFDMLTSSSASNEENRYQQTDEENQYHQRTNEENQYHQRTNEKNQYHQRTNEENQYHQRTNEENQYHQRTNEENQHRRMDEEDQYRRQMDEEKYHRRMDEEKYRRRMDEEKYRRINEENQHRRAYEENQHRRTYEENQHWRNEEKQYRRTNEEKQYRRTNEEKQYRWKNEENQYRRTHTNHNLVSVDQRLEKQSYRATLKSDRGYHATIIMDLTIQKRRIQEDGRFPVPVYMSDTNDWRIRSLKKQKLERR